MTDPPLPPFHTSANALASVAALVGVEWCCCWCAAAAASGAWGGLGSAPAYPAATGSRLPPSRVPLLLSGHSSGRLGGCCWLMAGQA